MEPTTKPLEDRLAEWRTRCPGTHLNDLLGEAEAELRKLRDEDKDLRALYTATVQRYHADVDGAIASRIRADTEVEGLRTAISKLRRGCDCEYDDRCLSCDYIVAAKALLEDKS